MKDFWVADDGSYGTSNIIMVDTSKWSQSDWHDFDSAPEYYKLDRAIEISNNRGEGGYEYA